MFVSIIVLLAVIGYGGYKHIALKKALEFAQVKEAALVQDLSVWLSNAQAAELAAVEDVKAHYGSVVQKLESLFAKFHL